jgi:hypothetical protein
MGQSRWAGASCRSNNVRNAPLATVGPKKAACRDGPKVGQTLTWFERSQEKHDHFPQIRGLAQRLFQREPDFCNNRIEPPLLGFTVGLLLSTSHCLLIGLRR